MALLVQKINAVPERMSDVLALPKDTPLLVLTGFTKRSVLEFVGQFKLMLNTKSVIKLENDGDRHYNRKFLEKVKKITLLASNSFHSLNISNQWNIPYNHRHVMAKRKFPCDNCDGEHCDPDFRILVTSPRSRRPRRSAQIVGAAVDAVIDAKVTAIIG